MADVPADGSALRRARTVSVVDGMLHAVMLGAGESYLGAFAVELGHGPVDLALLATLPVLAGSLAQLASPLLAGALPTRKSFVVLGATLQALCHLGFLWIAFSGERALWPLLGTKILFWASGVAIAPPWSAWMADIVPLPEREAYFARRLGMIQMALLASYGTSGMWLAHGAPLEQFRVLLVIALTARLVSALALTLQHDPSGKVPLEVTTWVQNFGETWKTSRWRTPLYLAALMFAAHIAVPFFTPYMLRELRLDYGSLALLTGTSVLFKAAVFPMCHPLAARFGLRRLLVASGVLIACLPALWASAGGSRLLFFAEALSGTAWAGLEYSSFQLLLQSSEDRHRTQFMALAGALSSALQVCGANVGGFLLQEGQLDYAVVFWCSSLARAFALVVLVASLPTHPARALRWIAARVLSVRPAGGTVQAPIAEAEPAEPSTRTN